MDYTILISLSGLSDSIIKTYDKNNSFERYNMSRINNRSCIIMGYM